MTSLQIVRNGLTGGRRGGLRWLPDTCWRQDRDGATVSPGPLVPQQRVPCGRRRAGSRGGGDTPMRGSIPLMAAPCFFLGCLAQGPPRNELTPVAGAQPEGMAPMLEGGSQLRGTPGCPGGRCDAGTMLAARGALGGWHPALRLVPMGGGTRCPWHVLGDTVVATGRLGCRARPLRCPCGGQGVAVPYLRWLRRWQQPRCGRAWPGALARGHPECTPGGAGSPGEGHRAVSPAGDVSASAAAVLLPPTPPDRGTWGTPTVVTAGRQRGGAGTLGTLPLGASPLQPTVGTRTPLCTAWGRWHPLHPHAGPPRSVLARAPGHPMRRQPGCSTPGCHRGGGAVASGARGTCREGGKAANPAGGSARCARFG